MRILHVSDAYLPGLGGIEMQVHDLAEQQQSRGHEVTVLTRVTDQAGDDPDRAGTIGPDVIRLGPARWGTADPLLRSVDVVHCHSSIVSPLAWTMARRAARAGTPVVITMHSLVGQSLTARTCLRRVASMIGPEVTWTAVSEVAARLLRPAVDRPVGVLPNGVDPSRWAAVGAPGDSPLTMVSVMRIAARKRALPLIGVLEQVRRQVDRDTEVRAVVVGDGPQLGAVRRRVRDEGMEDWVQLPGRLSRPQVAAQLEQAHLFLAPAHLESFGIAALEARCAGVPVVAMRGSGVAEFVLDGVEGRLVDSDREMADVAAELLADPEKLAQMRAHNLSTPTGLGWEHAVRRCALEYAGAGACDRGASTRLLPSA